MENNVPNWIEHKSLKKSEIARMIGLSPTTFQNKLDGYKGNRLTEKDLENLELVRNELYKTFAPASPTELGS